MDLPGLGLQQDLIISNSKANKASDFLPLSSSTTAQLTGCCAIDRSLRN